MARLFIRLQGKAKPFHVPPPVNQTFQSVLQVPRELWEKYHATPRKEMNSRDASYMILPIKLTVVDANPALQAAKNKIEEAQRKGMIPRK